MTKPILFSREMVLAILDGRKTQTRRALKHQPSSCHWDIFPTYKLDYCLMPCQDGLHFKYVHSHRERDNHAFMTMWGDKCPYGKIGDRLWVRENWSTSTQWNGTKPSALPFAPDQRDGAIFYQADYAESDIADMGPWRPSIFLPQRYARIELEITDVRVERLVDISEADALSEGIWRTKSGFYTFGDEYNPDYETAADAFSGLWQSINGPDSWEANPFVWCLGFQKVKPC